MADYTLAEYGVIRNADGAAIPADPENADWQRYLEWVADGNEPDPMPEPPTEPDPAEALRESARAKIAALADLTPEEKAALFGGEVETP